MNNTLVAAISLVFTLSMPSFAQWELIWSDEFDYTGLPEATKWGYDVGGSGWGNQELQFYTNAKLENARVENGTLIITALKEKVQQNNYSSARLVTKNKGDWLYGRFEIAAKLPKGVGLWPAIWMLPTASSYGIWPKSGEIDIMENVGFEPNIVHFTVHTESYNHSIGTSKGASAKLADPYTKFVVYALEWYEDSMVFVADDKKTFSFKNEGTGSKVWPFDKQFHLLLNIAVGGSWGGQQGVDDGICPAEMVVDYVRVYKGKSSGATISNGGKPDRTPAVTFSNNRLSIHSENPAATSVRIFSINGSMALDLTGCFTTARNDCAVSLARGSFVAALNDNGKCRTAMFTVMY